MVLRGVVSRVSQRIGILRMVNGVNADWHLCVSSLLLRLHPPYPWILFSCLGVCCQQSPSASWPSDSCSVLVRFSRLCPDQILKPLNHRRCVAGMCMLYKIHINPKHCLYGELPPACQRVRHTRAAAVAHPCELEVQRCRTSQFGRCFLPAHVRMWNDLPSSVFDSGTLNGFKGAVNRSLLP